LELINNNKIRSAKHFAELMWPDSPCWKKVYHVGRGATKGVGMWLASGSFLAKLRRQGLITHFFLSVDYNETITLTSKGRERLLNKQRP
ncbi:MAG: hypothetical protein JSV54_06375, partial [Chloroflexota bacterium]